MVGLIRLEEEKSQLSKVRLIDLTQSLYPGMPVFPVYPEMTVFDWSKIDAMGFAAKALFMVEHTGTHIDAPIHFIKGAASIADLPLEKFVGEAIILDLREIKHGKVLGLDDLESALGGREIKDGDKVLLRTGWEDHWDSDDYINSHSGLGKDAAEFLVKKGVDLVGIDTPNLDHPDASDFPAHHTLLGSQVLIVENLCNLGSIGRDRFTFIALPLKIKNGTGSPIRAIALL